MAQTGLQLVQLFVIEGDEREVLISPVLDERPVFLIGSDERAALRLDDPAVAVSHAAVNRRDDVYRIEARYPKLDVLVNGKRIVAATPLKPGDRIQIGATTLRFQQEERRVHATIVKPAAVAPLPVAVNPPLPKPAVFQPAPQALATTEGHTIYRPKVRKDDSRGSGLILLGFLAVIGVLVFGAYNLISAANASVVPPRLATDAYNDGNIAVLVFGQTGCTPCENQKQILDSLWRDFRGDVYLHNYSLDTQANMSFVEEYNIMYLPMMVVLDDSGNVVTMFEGVTDTEELRAAFEQALQESANN